MARSQARKPGEWKTRHVKTEKIAIAAIAVTSQKDDIIAVFHEGRRQIPAQAAHLRCT